MVAELTTIEKYMLAELFICGKVSGSEYDKITDIPQHGTGVRNQTLRSLRRKGALQQTMYQGEP